MDCRCRHHCRARQTWFQQPAPPTSRLFAHFQLSGSDALPRWQRPGSIFFELQQSSSETYRCRHGHYVHFILQSMVTACYYTIVVIPVSPCPVFPSLLCPYLVFTVLVLVLCDHEFICLCLITPVFDYSRSRRSH